MLLTSSVLSTPLLLVESGAILSQSVAETSNRSKPVPRHSRLLDGRSSLPLYHRTSTRATYTFHYLVETSTRATYTFHYLVETLQAANFDEGDSEIDPDSPSVTFTSKPLHRGKLYYTCSHVTTVTDHSDNVYFVTAEVCHHGANHCLLKTEGCHHI